MAGEEHRKLYKKSGKDTFEIQLAVKDSLLSGQRRERERLLTRKRLKVESLNEATCKLSAEKEQLRVEGATKLLKSGQKVEALTALHQCFARDSKNAETFIKCEGLPLLHSCLLSTNSSVLHAAAWCSINLTAADSHAVQKALRLSPFLIQFLSGSDSTMQELCAWAIGNLAGDSQSNKETLLGQGVIPHLLNLVSTPHHVMVETRTQSVLHALINLARDTTYKCCRCMLENSLFSSLKILLKEVPESSQLCQEIGWLTSCVYSREEIFSEILNANQCGTILHLVVDKLLHLSCLPQDESKEKMMIPYLLCCGNMIGLSTELALLASDLPMFLPAMKACLSSSSNAILLDTVWTLSNFCAEPSCRALVVSQSELMSRLLSLCNEADIHFELLSEVLSLMEGMVRVSCVMNRLLIKQGTLENLSHLLKNSKSTVADKILSIMEILLQDLDLPQQPPGALSYVRESLQYLTTISFDIKLVERTKAVMELFPLSTSSV
ncbi:hypothetical protein RRG08_050496 [Elysia crispata]|uniref:Importin subunit alpha n=1 Tax=Elysia crispata TaxID=231223 RepID=A0AAE0XSA2_9GAST|nr:hypothetical protein RRG08_050496 [Elysia crispata]